MNDIQFASDSSFKVTLDKNVLDTIIFYCENSNRKEIGGILVGNYSSDNNEAIISYASGPTKDSSASCCTFLRGTKGLKKMLDERWRNREFYLGEWHYHPLSSSSPSGQDIHQMRALASHRGLNCPEPILLIVGGGEDMGWEYSMHIVSEREIIQMWI